MCDTYVTHMSCCSTAQAAVKGKKVQATTESAPGQSKPTNVQTAQCSMHTYTNVGTNVDVKRRRHTVNAWLLTFKQCMVTHNEAIV